MEMLDHVLISLRQINRNINVHSKALRKELGLTSTQLVLMRTIHRHRNDDITVRQLSHHTSMSQATATTVLDRLERHQLITRTRSSRDRRKVIVELTVTGEQAVADAPQTAIPDNFANNFKSLNESDQFQLIASLKKINEMMLSNAELGKSLRS